MSLFALDGILKKWDFCAGGIGFAGIAEFYEPGRRVF
jgi:hypothetical protein